MDRIFLFGKSYPFNPDLVDWRCQNPPARFGFISIQQHHLWVKRTTGLFSGWPVIAAGLARTRPVPGTPPVVSIARHANDYFYFTSVIEDALTLDACPWQPISANPLDTLKPVIDALFHINTQGFWHPDLCPRNLIWDPVKRHLLLIDIDCCLPHATPWSHTLKVAHQYSVLLPHFAKQVLGVEVGLAALPPQSINQAELIALTMEIRLGRPHTFQSIHNALWDAHQKAYTATFRDLLDGRGSWDQVVRLVRSVLSRPVS